MHDVNGNAVNQAVVDISIPEVPNQNKELAELDRLGRTNSNGIVCFDYSDEYK